MRNEIKILKCIMGFVSAYYLLSVSSWGYSGHLPCMKLLSNIVRTLHYALPKRVEKKTKHFVLLVTFVLFARKHSKRFQRCTAVRSNRVLLRSLLNDVLTFTYTKEEFTSVSSYVFYKNK